MSALDLDAVRKRLRAVVRQRRAQAALLEADGKPEGAAVDYVRALITRLRAAEARTAWQPIETAPVGVEVMVTWADRQGLRHMSGGILLGTHWWTHGRVVTPTHWQPLLAPRAAAASR